MTLERRERRDDGMEGRQPLTRRRTEQRHEVAMRQIVEDEHRVAIALDEVVRRYEVRARDRVQELVLAPE